VKTKVLKLSKTNGTEAFVKEGTDALQRKVQSTTQADEGQEGSFECFLQNLMKI